MFIGAIDIQRKLDDGSLNPSTALSDQAYANT